MVPNVRSGVTDESVKINLYNKPSSAATNHRCITRRFPNSFSIYRQAMASLNFMRLLPLIIPLYPLSASVRSVFEQAHRHQPLLSPITQQCNILACSVFAASRSTILQENISWAPLSTIILNASQLAPYFFEVGV